MVYFLILHYIVEKETEKCVDSILKLKGEKRVVIVDNDSPNHSFEELQKYYQENKEVIVLKNAENNGFAKGNNYGYEYIKKNFEDIDFIIPMNNDMEIQQEDFIEKINEIYEKEKFYVLGPDIYSVEKRIHQNPETASRTIRTLAKVNQDLEEVKNFSPKKIAIKGVLRKIPGSVKLITYMKSLKRKKDTRYLEKAYNCTLHGSCVIFSKEFIEKRDYAFYPKTTFYCEAQILDYQCEINHWLRVYTPELHVIHYEDVATNASYQSYAKKLAFQNQCMIESLTAFKELMENKEG